jgi:hypothetical protein
LGISLVNLFRILLRFLHINHFRIVREFFLYWFPILINLFRSALLFIMFILVLIIARLFVLIAIFIVLVVAVWIIIIITLLTRFLINLLRFFIVFVIVGVVVRIIVFRLFILLLSSRT